MSDHNGNGTELAVRSGTEFMPVMTIAEAVSRYNAIVEFTKTVMKPDKDYGVIPGTQKPTLLKPGAEKLCTLFGLKPDFETAHVVEDWDKGFFYYGYKCVLRRGGEAIACGIGSCNSKEKKYRYRKAELKCPKCGKPAILRSKREPGWFCWAKKGGCGMNFRADDPAIVNQESGLVENTEPFELVNTLQKMAQKRALVAATLIATNASEFYTQDQDELIELPNVEEEAPIEGEIVERKGGFDCGGVHRVVNGVCENCGERMEPEPAKPAKPAAKVGAMDDDEKFIAILRDTFESRDFKPDEFSAAVAAVCKKKKITTVNKLSGTDRMAFLEAVAAGRFDNYKAAVTA